MSGQAAPVTVAYDGRNGWDLKGDIDVLVWPVGRPEECEQVGKLKYSPKRQGYKMSRKLSQYLGGVVNPNGERLDFLLKVIESMIKDKAERVEGAR